MRSRARIVGIALSNMVDFLNPEMIVLGGGMTDAMPDLIREEVEVGIKEHATARHERGAAGGGDEAPRPRGHHRGGEAGARSVRRRTPVARDGNRRQVMSPADLPSIAAIVFREDH